MAGEAVETKADGRSETPPWLPELIRLREAKGNPSTRKIAAVAGISHTTVADTLGGRRFPSLGTLLQIAEALGGSKETFIDLWRSEEDRSVDPLLRPSERELLQAILDELVLIRLALSELPATTRD